jgi:rubredoxin
VKQRLNMIWNGFEIRDPNSNKGVTELTQWQCSNCGYTFGAEAPPDRCPSCKQACTFSDVTCYIPDCGGPENIDPRLAAGKRDSVRKKE